MVLSQDRNTGYVIHNNLFPDPTTQEERQLPPAVQETFNSFELIEEEQREEEKEISEMTDEKLEEETNQTRTKTIQAKEFIKGKIPLDNLPQPYVIISDHGEFENLSKTINILAIKQNYRIVSFAATDVDDGINYGYVIMEKKGAA